jgi:glyoxylase-like metal-dependent hydrolase (beta-lactamase superfamily II)
MVRIERHGDVTRFEMTSVASRLIGYSASAYLVRHVLIDCGFHAARRAIDAILARERPGGVFITHYHEDHAGNVERVARLAIPLAASPDTFDRMRAPAPIRFYRRFTWGTAPPLVSQTTPFENDRLRLIAAPGHSADHHVVWDESNGTLFGGDLYLGVKVRVAHPGEDPRVLVATLRRIAALGPARLFDAHRGFVANPQPLLEAKADWTEEMIAAIERRIAAGAPDAVIVRELLGGESAPGYFSGGDYSRTNFVRAVRRTSSESAVSPTRAEGLRPAGR